MSQARRFLVGLAIIKLCSAAGSTVRMMDSSLSVSEGSTVSVCAVATLGAGESVMVELTVSGGSSQDLIVSTSALTLNETTISDCWVVSAVDDSVFEDTETVTLTLRKVGGSSGVTVSEGMSEITVTIVDDDDITVQMINAQQNIPEGESRMVCASLTGVQSLERDVVISYSFSASTGTAEAEDFTTPVTQEQRTFSGTHTSNKCVTVQTRQDTIFEEDDTFTVTLSVVSPMSERVTVSDGMSETTVTIMDDDGVTVQMSDEDSRINVPEGDQTPVCADLTGELERDVVVRMQTTTRTGFRAATAGSDYTSVDVLKTFSSGTTSHCVDVQTVQDNIFEYWEIFNVTLTSVSPTTRVTVNRGVTDIYIVNDETATISMRDESLTRNEGDTIEVCTRLDAPAGGTERDITVSILSSGMSTAHIFPSPSGVGDVQCKTLSIIDDSVFENSPVLEETFTLSSSQSGVTASGTTTLTVNDNDDVTVSMAASTVEFSEGAGSGGVCARLTGPAGGVAVPVMVTLTATGDIDRTSVVTFGAESSVDAVECATYTLPDNQIYQTSSVMMFTVSLSTSQSRVTAAGTLSTVVRVNDDDNPVIAFQQSTYSFGEATPEVTGDICVELRGPSELGVSFDVSFSVQGAATAGEDYSVVDSSLTKQFTVSDRVDSVKCISVRIVNDIISDPEETFTVTVSSTDSRVEGEGSVTVTIIDDDVMPPPRNLAITDKTSRSVALSWDPPDPSGYDTSIMLVGYTIEWNDLSEIAITVTTTLQQYIITDLVPYQLYRFSVRGNFNGGNIGEKAFIEERPLEEAPGSSPAAFNLFSSTATSLTLSWREPAEPNGVITHYTLYTDYQNGSNSVHTTSSTEYTLSQLSPYQTVSVQLSATTSVGEGPRTTSMEFITDESKSDPVGNLTVIRANNSIFRVEWSEPAAFNGVFQLYTVQINTGHINVKLYTTIESSFTIEGLAPYTPYEISVSAVNGAGVGETQTITEFTEEGVPSTHPRDMVLSRTSGVSAVVSWRPLTLTEARGFITGYEISYWTVGSDGLDMMSVRVSGGLNSTVITGLDPDSEYYITLSASTVVGRSNTSSPAVLSRPVMQGTGSVIIGAVVGTVATVVNILILGVCFGLIALYIKRHKVSSKLGTISSKPDDREYEEVKLPRQQFDDDHTQKCEAYGLIEMSGHYEAAVPTQDPLYEHVH